MASVPDDDAASVGPRGPRERPARSHARRAMLWAAVAAGALSCAACKQFAARQTELPAQEIIYHDQLVVYTDFKLAADHRLLEELAAERRELLSTLAMPPTDEPIHVYLFETNEAFREFIARFYPTFPERRAFFMQSDTRLAVYAHWGDRIAEDLRHEVAHGYLHSVIPHLPLWLDEGLAEYAETPPGTHGMNLPHVQLLTNEIFRNGWRPNLERLELLDNTSQMTQTEYAEAWAWVHWLLESDPALRTFLQSHLGDLRERQAGPALSARIRERSSQPEVLLCDHVLRLAAAKEAPGTAQ